MEPLNVKVGVDHGFCPRGNSPGCSDHIAIDVCVKGEVTQERFSISSECPSHVIHVEVSVRKETKESEEESEQRLKETGQKIEKKTEKEIRQEIEKESDEEIELELGLDTKLESDSDSDEEIEQATEEKMEQEIEQKVGVSSTSDNECSKVQCYVCGKKFSKRVIEWHQTSAKGKWPHKCHMCPKKFCSLFNLTKHVRSQHFI